ncbi:MAG TPA: ABC transporter permease, partial [Chloroflexaceae bacterium]|nr:ABC transporter permease [Chloroflexaceae bacterium]
GDQANEEQIRLVRQRYQLDQPVIVQYMTWAGRVLRGDFGTSHRSERPIAPDLARAFFVSLALASSAMVLAIAIGVPLGIIAAIRRDGFIDLVVMSLASAGMAIPSFWLALIFILLFALQLGWLPSSGWDSWRHLILPAVTLSLSPMALLARMTRAVMVETLLEDYVRTARAKGLPERVVLLRHALRNTLLPLITVIGLRLGLLLGGAVITETIFAIPGVGRTIVSAVSARDYPVVQAGVLVIAFLIAGLNLLVDLLYAVFDPRIRYQ